MNWKQISFDDNNNPEVKLADFINRSSYFRMKNQEKKKILKGKYHKGYELRIGCCENEIETISRICEKLSIKAGHPYKKVHKWVLPIYGKKNMEIIGKLISTH